MGLEAAIFWRSRNRALVQYLILMFKSCAEEFIGSKQYTDTLSIFIKIKKSLKEYLMNHGVAERWVNLELLFLIINIKYR